MITDLRSLMAIALLGVCVACSADTDVTETPHEPSEAISATDADGTQSLSERTEVIAGCLRDEGLAVEVTYEAGTAGFTYDNRIVSNELFDEKFAVCQQQLEAEGAIGPPPSGDPAYLASVYRKLVDAARCLEEAGYEIPPPASEDAWVESRGAAWNPFDEIARADGLDSAAEAQELCGI